jgi:polysaccharide biosynthesis/export protein
MLAIVLQSCIIQKNIKYLQPRTGLENQSFPVNTGTNDYKIQRGDILSIQINSTVATSLDIIDNKFKNDKGSSGDELFGYDVDAAGNITLPLLGNIKLEGLTLSAASDTVKARLEEYVKYVTVKVKMKSLRFTVLGEVKNPGEKITIYSKTNLFEVMGICGDFTYYAEKKKVKLIRKENNTSTVYYLDFTDKNLLTSDKFYIMPNDIFIVDTKNSKLIQENLKNVSIYTSIISIGLLLYYSINRIK